MPLKHTLSKYRGEKNLSFFFANYATPKTRRESEKFVRCAALDPKENLFSAHRHPDQTPWRDFAGPKPTGPPLGWGKGIA
jgi:hypothetical protein